MKNPLWTSFRLIYSLKGEREGRYRPYGQAAPSDELPLGLAQRTSLTDTRKSHLQAHSSSVPLLSRLQCRMHQHPFSSPGPYPPTKRPAFTCVSRNEQMRKGHR